MFKKIIFLLLFITKVSISQNKIATVKTNTVAITDFKNDSIFEYKYQIANKLYKEKKTEEALKLLLEILETAKKKHSVKHLIKLNHRLGYILRRKHYLKRALYYSHKALRHSLSLKDTSNIINEKASLGKIHFDLYKKDSLVYIKSLDSIEYYAKSTLSQIANSKKYLKQKQHIYSQLIVLNYFKKNYVLSKEYSLKSFAVSKELNDTIGQINSLNGIANYYTNIKNYKKSKTFYEKALNLVEKSTDADKIKYKNILYQNLAYIHYNLKHYKAYDYLFKANQLKDSMQGVMTDTIVAKLELKHNVEIAKKEAEEERQIEIKKKENLQAWSIALGLLLVGTGITFWNYSVNSKLKRKNITLQYSKTRLLKEKEIERLENETQIKILNATLDGKEAERKQIAETLHDSVSALLSAANLHLQASKSQYKGESPIEIDKTQIIIDEASVKIRKLSHELISSVLLKFGLAHAIQNFCEKYSNSRIDISCISRNMARYDQSFEIKVNNIVEEFINNILKHSKAHHAFVSIQEQNQKLAIRIQDDGKGFDTKNSPKSDGIGLNQIAARIKMMKGTLNIESEINEGTSIQIEVPVVYKNYN